MTIKQQGGIFGRNPTFNNLTVDGQTYTQEITAQNEMTVSKISNATFTLESTSAGLGADNAIGIVNFYGNDASTPGAGIKASIEARTEAALGDDAALVIKTSSGTTNSIETARFRAGTGLVFPSGYGIDFSATSGTGTSELLSDYEEGVWSPTAADAISGGNTGTIGNGSYTKIGNFIMVTAALSNINTTGMTAGNTFHIQGLPFASGDVPAATAYFVNSGVFTSAVTTASPVQSFINDTGVSALYFYDSSGTILVSDITSGAGDFYFTAIYKTA